MCSCVVVKKYLYIYKLFILLYSMEEADSKRYVDMTQEELKECIKWRRIK